MRQFLSVLYLWTARQQAYKQTDRLADAHALLPYIAGRVAWLSLLSCPYTHTYMCVYVYIYTYIYYIIAIWAGCELLCWKCFNPLRACKGRFAHGISWTRYTYIRVYTCAILTVHIYSEHRQTKRGMHRKLKVWHEQIDGISLKVLKFRRAHFQYAVLGLLNWYLCNGHKIPFWGEIPIFMDISRGHSLAPIEVFSSALALLLSLLPSSSTNPPLLNISSESSSSSSSLEHLVWRKRRRELRAVPRKVDGGILHPTTYYLSINISIYSCMQLAPPEKEKNRDN